MEAVRLIEEPKNGMITIRLPEKLRGNKKVEVIILPVEDAADPKKPFDISKFRGVWKDTDIDVAEISRRMREEWKRDF
ncbi:MAG: hypothetical protein ACOCWY_04955 [Thermodesulfobacteriota bacterium]